MRKIIYYGISSDAPFLPPKEDRLRKKTLQFGKALEQKEIELGHALFELEELKEKTDVPRCVVCMDANANMSFVHGNTAHLACCEACAQKFEPDDVRRPATNAEIFGESDTDDDDAPPRSLTPPGTPPGTPPRPSQTVPWYDEVDTLTPPSSRCPICRQGIDLIVKQF